MAVFTLESIIKIYKVFALSNYQVAKFNGYSSEKSQMDRRFSIS